ncbi:MAG: energy-coupling factor transporter transmembrane component T [Candidatus Beckwithbacteria bacterium]
MFPLILLLAFSTILIFIRSWQLLLFIFVILIGIISLKQSVFKRLKPLLFTLILLFLFQLLLNQTQTVSVRLTQMITAGLKIVNLSLLVFYYTSTHSPAQISQAFSFLPASGRLILTMTFSLIPLIFKEAKTILVLQKSRGYRSRNPLPIIIPLLHRTFKRSEQIALSLTSRGY